MVDLLTPEDYNLVNVSEPWKTIFIEAANSAVARLAPCLVGIDADEGRRAEARLIVLRAIERVRGTPAFAKSQTTGPFSITYLTDGRGILDKGDRSELAALCDTVISSGPLGSFPVADCYDDLFVRPRSPRGGRRVW